MLRKVHIINQHTICSRFTSPKHCTFILEFSILWKLCYNFGRLYKGCGVSCRCSQPCRFVTSFIIAVNWLPNNMYILKVTCRAKRKRFTSIITRVFETSDDAD